MTDEEYCIFETGVGRSTNPKAINRTMEAGPQEKRFYSHSKNAEAEIAKRKHLDPSSSSDDEYSDDSSGSESKKHGSTMERRTLRPTSLGNAGIESNPQPLKLNTRSTVLEKVQLGMTT